MKRELESGPGPVRVDPRCTLARFEANITPSRPVQIGSETHRYGRIAIRIQSAIDAAPFATSCYRRCDNGGGGPPLAPHGGVSTIKKGPRKPTIANTKNCH